MATLSCYDCGATYGADGGQPRPARKRCDCGEPLWFDVGVADLAWPPDGTDRGVWRYADLLPVDTPDEPTLGAAAGDTPLIRAGRLDDLAGCRVWVKDEGENPTGSFKDRGSAVGVAATAAGGGDWVGTVSHGNMAMSTSALATASGLDCLVLVPADISGTRLGLIAGYDPTLLAVDGDYGRLYHDTLALDSPVEFVNSDTPLRVAGQKTTALELVEQFPDGAPDAVVLPVSSGGHASAIWKGLRELDAAGVLEELPRIYLVQTAACDPIARADREDADEVTGVEAGETVAYSIANGDPPSGDRALAAVRATGGAVISVDDDAIRTAQRRFATRAGLRVEVASATTLAGLARLADRGEVRPDEDVVCVATGTGFKEFDGIGEADATVDLDGLAAAVADAVE